MQKMRQLRRHGIGLLVILATTLVLLAEGEDGAASASTRSVDHDYSHVWRPAEFAGFPLWKDVPRERFATLHEGSFYGTRWGAYASAGSSDEACLTVARITGGGLYGVSQGCGVLAPATGIQDPPVHPSNSIAGPPAPGERLREKTFAAMSFDPSVVRVEVRFDKGPPLKRNTTRIGSRTRAFSSLPPMRFVAFAWPRAVCIKRIVGWNREGVIVLKAPTDEC